jgi:uncharacterized membrane protein
MLASAATLLAVAAFIFVYLLIQRRRRLGGLPTVVRAFVPAGLVLALAYGALLEAFDRGRVTVVAPLNATGSLWAVLLAALVIGRGEMIGRRTIASGLLVARRRSHRLNPVAGRRERSADLSPARRQTSGGRVGISKKTDRTAGNIGAATESFWDDSTHHARPWSRE